MLGSGAPRVGRYPTPDRPSLGRAAGARYRQPVGTGDVGVANIHQPDCTRSCVPALRAVRAARGRLGGGACCLAVRRLLGMGALPRPTARP